MRDKYLIVEFRNGDLKSKVMKEKHKLSKIPESKLFIDPHFTLLEQKIQNSIKSTSWDLRKKGHKTKIRYGKLLIDVAEWVWNYSENRLSLKTQPNASVDGRSTFSPSDSQPPQPTSSQLLPE